MTLHLVGAVVGAFGVYFMFVAFNEYDPDALIEAIVTFLCAAMMIIAAVVLFLT